MNTELKTCEDCTLEDLIQEILLLSKAEREELLKMWETRKT